LANESRLADQQSDTAELVDLFCDLVLIASPTGQEGSCVEAVESHLVRLGLHPVRDGTGKSIGSDGDNVLCRIPPKAEGTALFFCAHLDTVPLTGSIDPVVTDGVIRNASPSILGADNKAAVAVLLDAVRTLLADAIPHAGIELLFTIGEEQGLIGSHAFDSSVLVAKTGFVYDHSGAIGGYVAAAPSRYIVRAAVHGRAAHAGISPEEGANAIVALARGIVALSPSTPGATVNVATISGGLALNVVPELAQVEVDVRAIDHDVAGATVETVKEALHAAADQSGCSINVSVENPYVGYRIPPDSEALRLAASALARLGQTTFALETRGGSDANVLRARGLDCLNLNHGVIGFHTAEEQVAIVDLELMKRLTLALIAEAVHH
jgi:tripeptide aminopeptidase